MRYIVLVILIIAVLGCSFENNVYVAFIWSDGEKPDSFSSNIPNVPDDIDSIAIGGNILTFPGTYTLSYSYISPVSSQSFTFTLEENSTVLGREDKHYHIYLKQFTTPYILEYPY